ncbi:MAG: hypothetical protein IJS72_02885 [Oscillospiraceae bacterium]|nr:hypothetical protein [Oscillospiraceae bacterium]
MPLFQPKWKSKHEKTALRDAEKGHYGKEDLIEICRYAPLLSVRLAAFDRLAKLPVGYWITPQDKADKLDMAARFSLQDVSDPETLLSVIRTAEVERLRYRAALNFPQEALSQLIPELNRFSERTLSELALWREDLRPYVKPAKQEKQTNADLLAHSDGSFTMEEVEGFSDPADVHLAFQLARTARQRRSIRSDVYDRLIGKLTDPADVTQALTEHRLSVGSDGLPKLFGIERTKVWRLLSEQTDPAVLEAVAANAETRAIRWKACKLLGGHSFPDSGKRCKCTRCGFEKHTPPAGTVSGRAYTCTVCGGYVEACPFSEGLPHSTITFPGAKQYSIEGYDGMQYDEDQFAERFRLF